MPSRVSLSWDGGENQVLRTRDVSEGGVFLVSDGGVMPPIGTAVTLQVQDELGGGGAPVVYATVVRETLDGIGLQFDDDPSR